MDNTTAYVIGKANAGDDLSGFTPQEIDAAFADLYGKSWTLSRRIEAYLDHIAQVDKGVQYAGHGRDWYVEQVAHLQEERENVRETVGVLHAEFTRRGGWTRAFLVTNAGGHVHSSMDCSTCYPRTQYHWVTELSDHDEDEIVEKAGQRACTVCYPSAPVEVLARPTQIFTPDEVEKQRAREEREAKKAAAQAAQVEVPGYVGWRGKVETKVFKSVRAATNDIASNLSSLCWYGNTHPSANEWLTNVLAVQVALDARGEMYDYDKALANARKRVTREGGEPKF